MTSIEPYTAIATKHDFEEALRPYNVGNYEIEVVQTKFWRRVEVRFNVKWWQKRRRRRIVKAWNELNGRFAISILPVRFCNSKGHAFLVTKKHSNQ